MRNIPKKITVEFLEKLGACDGGRWNVENSLSNALTEKNIIQYIQDHGIDDIFWLFAKLIGDYRETRCFYRACRASGFKEDSVCCSNPVFYKPYVRAVMTEIRRRWNR